MFDLSKSHKNALKRDQQQLIPIRIKVEGIVELILKLRCKV
jgi:hypothetical protein